MYAFLAEHRRRLFPGEMFADLFPSGRGRPSVPADVVATVMLLQSLEGLSDRDAIVALRTDLRWKVAAGLALGDEGFHPTVLTLWRNKLRGSKQPQRIFDAVRQVVAETGVLKGKTRRALDSTLLDDAVATQDTVTQLVSMIRRVRAAIPAAAEVEVSAHDYAVGGKPACAWNDPAARDELVTALVKDALAILGRLDGVVLDADQAELVALLALVAGQDVEPDPERGEGAWRIARNVAKDRVISTVDPETRHMHKSRSNYRDGYKAHRCSHRSDQAVAARPQPPPRRRPVRSRRLHRRPPEPDRDLPRRPERPHQPRRSCHLRHPMQRLPCTGPLHIGHRRQDLPGHRPRPVPRYCQSRLGRRHRRR